MTFENPSNARTLRSPRRPSPRISRQGGRSSFIEQLENRQLMAAVARIEVGGGAYTDTFNNPWQADTNFTGGTAFTSNFTVAGTNDPTVYTSRRQGTNFSYAIPVANGTYSLIMNFAEPTFTQAGQRVETVFAEGQVAFFGVDIVAIAGASQKALDLQTQVTVTDGTLNLNIAAQTNEAILSGIRLLTTPVATPDRAQTQFSAVVGRVAGGPIVNLFDTGTAPLSINSVQILGTDAALFSVTGALSGGLLQPTQYTPYNVTFSPPAGTPAGLKTATLRFFTDDFAHPTVDVALRALATPGEGGTNEPSLQTIFNLYSIPVQTGDANPANTQLFSNTQPIGANDEVNAQLLAKAGTGPVTIQPLDVFGVSSNPAVYLNWYESRDISQTHQLFSFPTAAAQTVNPFGSGSLTFDPGSTEFGFSTNWPGFADGSNVLTSRQRTVYQSDVYNTGEKNLLNRHKTRVYPLKNADGTVVPNAYIVAFEEFFNDTNGSYDNQDLVMIVRNVRPVTQGRLSLTNQDGPGTFNNQLPFNNVAQGKGTNITHTSSVLRINNSSAAGVTINSLTIPDGYTVTGLPSTPYFLNAGGYIDLTVNFTSTVIGTHYSTLSINTDEALRPTVNVSLRGKLNRVPENGEEATLRQILNDQFGYKTNVGGQDQFTAANGAATKIGDEVLSPLWEQADTGKRIYVRALATFHTANNVSQFYWFPESDPTFVNTNNTPLFTQLRSDSQSLLPRKTTTGNPPAEAYFDMGSAVFGFAFRDGSSTNAIYYSLDSQNDAKVGAPDQHLFRFYPAKDQNNLIIPDTYLVGVDFNGVNYDYQDGIFLISNIRPKGQLASPRGVGLQQTPAGVVINWAPNTESTLLGYNVYRSTSPGTGLVKLNSTRISSTVFTDTQPLAGQTVYYYIVAVPSTGTVSLQETEKFVTA